MRESPFVLSDLEQLFGIYKSERESKQACVQCDEQKLLKITCVIFVSSRNETKRPIQYWSRRGGKGVQ